jgi:type IV pilus assembly protein PilY1
MKPITSMKRFTSRLLKNVASGLQPGAPGAQEPQCTQGVHEDSGHCASPDQDRAVVFQLPALGLAFVLCTLVPAMAYGAATDIAPAPLANASTTVVKPNLMFILDDSGSMDRDHMPDWVDDDEICKDRSTWGVDYLRNCQFGDPAYNNSGVNAVYYNPAVTYEPPVLFDGTSMKSYDDTNDWAAVPYDGFGVQSTSNINLRDNGIPDYVWCSTNWPSSSEVRYENIPNNRCKLPIENGIWKYPNSNGTQYRYRKSMTNERYPYYYVSTQAIGDPNQLLWCDTQDNSEPERGLGRGVYPPASGQASCSLKKDEINPLNTSKRFRYPKYGTWQRIEIKPGNFYPRSETRSDCSGSVGAVGCSYNEEMTNFANWHAYYRTRMQAMKSAAGHAFVNVDDRFRVGFMTINPGSPVDSGQFLGVNNFDATHKENWFDMFYGQAASGGTPLREALSRVGRYYANATGGINNGIGDDPIQYSCQQNFSILTTDGYWNGASGDKLDGTSIGDHDSNAATAPRPLLDGNSASGTLADVAQYYYITDLRNTGSIGALGIDVSANNVPGKPATDVQNDSASWQHMTTFTVGLGVDGTLTYRPDYRENPAGDFLAIKSGTSNWPTPSSNQTSAIDDLWHAAVNGRAKYFSAKNPTSLSAGLTEALVGVNATVGSAAAAATSNLEPIVGDNFVYIANYETVYWNGNVEARSIDLSTGTVSTSPVWSAQQQLDAKAASLLGGTARKIVFHKPGATNNLADFFGSAPQMDATELSWFSAAWISGGGGAPLSQWSTLTPSQQGAAGNPKNLVYYLRGESMFEAQASNPTTNHFYRDRTSVLGDIVNAKPVYVKTVNAEYIDTGFLEFKTCMNTGTGTGCTGARAASVYVAANDGMLHALDAGTGDERWAFIPRTVMPRLYRLADMDYANRHEYFVDGSPTVGDVYDPVAGAWRTILVAGLNSGGRGYYALDVTDPDNPIALWEFTARDAATCPSATILDVDTDDCDLGLSYGNPLISKLSNGDWVVMMTSGYNNVAPGNGKGYLYVLDPITGIIENKIQAANATQGINPGSTTSPLGLAKISNWVNDTNTSNTTLRVYGGDMEGNLWRFDPNTGTAFVLAQLKDGRSAGVAMPQPITTKPELGDANGKALISVGTGRYLGASDMADTQPQSIYTVKDTTNGVAPSTPINARGSTVVEQVITDSVDPLGNPIRTITSNAVDLGVADGWRVDLPISGERVNVDPRLQLGTLLVASNIPANDACTAGGSSYLNFFDYRTGSFIASSGSTLVGTKIANSLAVGISVVRLPNKKTVAIVTTSENKHPTLAPPFQAQGPTGRRSSWRELSQ